jgi:hypothetical protein
MSCVGAMRNVPISIVFFNFEHFSSVFTWGFAFI